jgi:pimeloyl-ACP methyl ester carboxylesterase
MSGQPKNWHNFTIAPFLITLDDEILDDLRLRIGMTRWPDPAPGEPWSQGTDLEYLRDLLAYWADGFDWRAQERALNVFPQFTADLDGEAVHYVHIRARSGVGVPLVLTHGWPSTFVEMLPLVPLLGDAFDLVIPSLPGYGFSPRAPRTGIDRRYVAGLWHRLMRGLGYERFGAHGTDFGAGVATFLALDHPDDLLGIHLTTFELSPVLDERSHPLSAEERAYLEHTKQWDAVERGYSEIQSTKPQTVGYGLNDSPAGLAAWVVEKWRTWSDSHGDLDATVSRDTLLTMLTIFWATRTITSSMRDYYDNRWSTRRLTAADHIGVPTAFARFGHEFVPEGDVPRSFAERLYNVQRWTSFPRGGHFAATEQPALVASDISAFFMP